MSRRRTKSTTGWAALSLQQKQKPVHGPEIYHESFPDLPGSRYSPPSKSNKTINRSFSSAALPSATADGASPAPLGGKHTYNNKPTGTAYSNGSGGLSSWMSQEKNENNISKRLKALYHWADESLIEDILAAVDTDFEKACSSLKAMVSDESSANNDDMSNAACEFVYDCKQKEVESNSYRTASNKSCSVDRFASVPVEPEWEEDDLYLVHRKDAIRIMREASRHSKAAANSYMRGDHFSAQQLSQKARDEWAAAEDLHEKAARGILSLRNEKNGIWKLDLHGLHASEAVKALQERLNLIETQVSSKSSLLVRKTGEAALDGCSNKGNEHDDMDKFNDGFLIKQRPVWLEVITGVGNHSRGEAAIPAAVRTFLLDFSYRFDEARPGIVMVRPKFRQS